MTSDKFDKIVKDYKKLIYAISYKFVRDEHEAENLVQDSFLALFQNFDRYQNEDIKNILCKIALNKCRDYLKSRVECESIDEMYDLESGENVFKQVVKSEEKKLLTDCIDSLTETYKVSIKKYYIEEKTLEEVAEETNVSKEVLKVQLTRAKKRLKELLLARGYRYD